MKKILLYFSASLLVYNTGLFAQISFWDSKDAYLGETPPGDTPRIFAPGKLADTPYYSNDRLVFSPDGKEIYYGVNTKWYDGTNQKLKYFKYEDGKWNGPFTLMEHYNTQIFSMDGKTMYLMGGPDPNNLNYSRRTDNGWAPPRNWGSHNTILYDFTPTISGQIYGATSNFTGEPKRPGNFDVCTMTISGKDTIVKTLGVPVNAPGWNGDFFIAPDESYLIISAKESKDYECELYISYRKPNRSWTNPKSLGQLINGDVSHRWGVTVTPDNLYMFYTYGETEKLTAIYWVRFDKLLEKLKHTNFEPYVKDSLTDQSTNVNNPFTFKLNPDHFYDDDGNNTLKYSATSPDGSPLSAWLKFDKSKMLLSGTPKVTGVYKIKVIATDPAGAKAESVFSLTVID